MTTASLFVMTLTSKLTIHIYLRFTVAETNMSSTNDDPYHKYSLQVFFYPTNSIFKQFRCQKSAIQQH